MGSPEADFFDVCGLAGEGDAVFVGVGELFEDVGDVTGDGPVVVGLDGDVVVGGADDRGHDSAHGTDEVCVDEGGDLFDVEFVLGEAHAGDDLVIFRGWKSG